MKEGSGFIFEPLMRNINWWKVTAKVKGFALIKIPDTTLGTLQK